MVDNDDKACKDMLSPEYGSVLRENAILTTFSAFLFGFLLNIAINPSEFYFPRQDHYFDIIIFYHNICCTLHNASNLPSFGISIS